MNERGPIRKRSDQRIRRNKDAVPTEKVYASGSVEIPDLDIEDAHPIIRDLYRSLRDSAQSRFYEPSDWQYARLALFLANQQIKSHKPNGQILATVNQMLTTLLVSEGDRRRVQLEIERQQADEAMVDVATMFAQQLGAQQFGQQQNSPEGG